MRKKILFAVFALLASLSSSLSFVAPSYADSLCSDDKVLGVTTWCAGLTDTEFQDWKQGKEKIGSTISKIALNIGAMIGDIGAYIAVALVMYGGFLYMTSAGDPGKAVKGRKTIINSVIGIIITKSASLIMGTIRGVGNIVNNGSDAGGVAADLANEFLFWGGIICVLMIMWGGFQYTTSAGDPGKAAKAKQTLLYSIVGLVIMIVAGAIVNFAIKAVGF